MKQVDEFVKAAGGRRVVADTCGITVEAVRVWTVNNEINRTYLPTLEKLARDRKCFTKFKRAATARGDYLAGETAYNPIPATGCVAQAKGVNDMDILSIPMDENDAEAKTIGEYLRNLLLAVWQEKEGFSGKRPFGNSSWEYELVAPLVKAGIKIGVIDEFGDVESVDEEQLDSLITNAIREVFAHYPA